MAQCLDAVEKNYKIIRSTNEGQTNYGFGFKKTIIEIISFILKTAIYLYIEEL
jgi:hypothetical protein